MNRAIKTAMLAAGALLATTGVSHAQQGFDYQQALETTDALHADLVRAQAAVAAKDAQLMASWNAEDNRLKACAAAHGGLSMRPCINPDPVCIAKYGSADACITGVLGNHIKQGDLLIAKQDQDQHETIMENIKAEQNRARLVDGAQSQMQAPQSVEPCFYWARETTGYHVHSCY